MTNWKRRLEIAAAADIPAAPYWTENSVPNCDDACPHHDGKRCQLMGLRAGGVCEPVVIEMARVLGEVAT